jgi:deaminated glutathione amidase
VTTLRVAALQMDSGRDVAANVEAATALLERALEAGATYVQTPEYFNYLGSPAGLAEAAEPVPGPTTRHFAALAKAARATIHLGSIPEIADSGKFHNTSVVIGPSGDVVARYRKAHLFDVAVTGEVASRESDAVEAGADMVLARLPGARVGLSICFDVRFPELYRRLAGAGAQVLAIPAAFSAATGRVHWHVLVRARAIENHAFVVAAAQAGARGTFPTYGHSLIVDPWGQVLAEGPAEGEAVLVADLDLDEVARRRAQIAVLDLARPDVYGGDVTVLDTGNDQR